MKRQPKRKMKRNELKRNQFTTLFALTNWCMKLHSNWITERRGGWKGLCIEFVFIHRQSNSTVILLFFFVINTFPKCRPRDEFPSTNHRRGRSSKYKNDSIDFIKRRTDKKRKSKSKEIGLFRIISETESSDVFWRIHSGSVHQNIEIETEGL